MRRAVKEQIETILVFEIAVFCVTLSVAIFVKLGYNLGLSRLSPVFQTSFSNAWLKPFFVLSIVVVLLNVWGFVCRAKYLKNLAKKFGVSLTDMAEAIYKHGFSGAIGDSFANPPEDFKAWLEEQRRDAETTTVIEIG